ncbi:MazG-like family protein [Streptomyces sp. NPDC001404]|uniref:MazG-like family protein n=1 Tax=Streptomyces sp. NPDC001404 TaxID=3364571 RepID=UPI0036CFAA07
MTARDDLHAYLTNARHRNGDHLEDDLLGLDRLLDRHEREVRATVANELHRAPLPCQEQWERADIVARKIRSIDTRLALAGRASDYWVPEPDPNQPPPQPLWEAARKAALWLDETNGVSRHETALRLMKLTEEAGKVTAAYIGLVGQNPRKGVTHTRGDVAAELCGVIITAATALHLFADDPAAALDDHARLVGRRINVAGD